MIAAQTAILVNHQAAARGLAVILYVDESTLSIAVTQDGERRLLRFGYRRISCGTPGLHRYVRLANRPAVDARAA